MAARACEQHPLKIFCLYPAKIPSRFGIQLCQPLTRQSSLDVLFGGDRIASGGRVSRQAGQAGLCLRSDSAEHRERAEEINGFNTGAWMYTGAKPETYNSNFDLNRLPRVISAPRGQV
jgi:hypothetical protein